MPVVACEEVQKGMSAQDDIDPLGSFKQNCIAAELDAPCESGCPTALASARISVKFAGLANAVPFAPG